jgi:hypothetical protein
MEVMVPLSEQGKPTHLEDLQLPIYHFMDGKPSGEHIHVDQRVAETPIRRDLIHRVVLWQQANRRKGYFEAKQRGEVAGSGIKLRPQKGLGMARVGESRCVKMSFNDENEVIIIFVCVCMVIGTESRDALEVPKLILHV